MLVEDDPTHTLWARRLVDSQIASEEPVLISLLVLRETEWVLRSRYQGSVVALFTRLEIRPREQPDTLIGVIGLMDQSDDNRGFWLDPLWQGKGLMTEASDPVTHYWFETLGKEVSRVPKAITINLR